MAKLCSYCNKYPVFSGGLCKIHQYLNPKAKKITKKQHKPIKKSSDKRALQLDEYYIIKEEMLSEAIKTNNYRCFFCNNDFDKDYVPDIHHLTGRDNEKLTDIKNLVLTHHGCHTLYHSLCMGKITKYIWYKGFLERLKNYSIDGYNKELRRLDRANIKLKQII
jgi:hypothetical protein